MNPQSDSSQQYVTGFQAAAPSRMPETRPLYWSVRRELWENRSIYIAPLLVAAVVLFSLLIGMITLPRRMRALPANDPVKQHAAVVRPFSAAPAPIMLTALIVGVFYCLDALYGERRDRSILFWKSLPVSDVTTVLSKAMIPVVVLPLIAFALSVITMVIMLFLFSVAMMASGLSPAVLWTELRFIQEPVIMLYGLTVHALWFAPIYGWLLLISAWARRTPFLWTVLPPLTIAIVEKIVFNSTHFVSLLQYRLVGAMEEAFVDGLKHGAILDQVTQLDPARFLSAPGLWVGLAAAAGFLAATVRLRRYREPI